MITQSTRLELCNAAIAHPEMTVTELARRFKLRRTYCHGVLKRSGIVRRRDPVYGTGVVIPGIPPQPKEFVDAMHRHSLKTATKEDEEFTDACIAAMKQHIRARNPRTDPQRGENDWMPPVVSAPGKPIEESLI